MSLAEVVKVDHQKRRWAIVGRKYTGKPHTDIWYTGFGGFTDEEHCQLYTKTKALEVLEALCSPGGGFLEEFAYQIVRVR